MTKEQIEKAVTATIHTRLDTAGFSKFKICCNSLGSPCTIRNAEVFRAFMNVKSSFCVGDCFTVMVFDNTGKWPSVGGFDVFVSETDATILADRLK